MAQIQSTQAGDLESIFIPQQATCFTQIGYRNFRTSKRQLTATLLDVCRERCYVKSKDFLDCDSRFAITQCLLIDLITRVKQRGCLITTVLNCTQSFHMLFNKSLQVCKEGIMKMTIDLLGICKVHPPLRHLQTDCM